MLRVIGCLAVSAVCGGAPYAALAGSLSFTNSTDVVAYQANGPATYFSGANPYVGGEIGADFVTQGLTVSAVNTGGGTRLSFAYTTTFSGAEQANGVTVGAADIFLRPGNAGYNGAGFSYAIALGQQAGNGGVAAGFYQVAQDETSQQIWASRDGFVYGGAYTDSTAYQPGSAQFSAFAAPTVVTAGHRLGGALLATTALPNGLYQVDATITLSPAQEALFANGFDVFWGTGDCGNGAFLTEVPYVPVMEPASFLLLVVGATLVVVGRQDKLRLRHAARSR